MDHLIRECQNVRYFASLTPTGALSFELKDYPLHMACASGNQELVDWILTTPAGQKQIHKPSRRPDDFPWNRALEYNHHELAFKLVNEQITFILSKDDLFWNTFQIALECESMALIDWLWPYAEKQEVGTTVRWGGIETQLSLDAARLVFVGASSRIL